MVFVANQRMGQGTAVALEQLRAKREEASARKEESKQQLYDKKRRDKAIDKTKKKLEKFSKAVESKNVKGTIPTVESRGVHNMVVYNPFKSPEKELERDTRTGLLHVKNSIWG